MEITPKQHQQIEEAASILKAGGVVAFPTETVYGLGADATNLNAIQQVYNIKKRPLHHPVIVHLNLISQVKEWAKVVHPYVHDLIHHFWPGPLTFILPKQKDVPNIITGGQETIAIRMPDHPIALALLEKAGRPLIAPSANRFGSISPTHSDHVKKSLGNAPDLIIQGGYCKIGIESTILDVSTSKPRILRLGAIISQQIEEVIGIPCIWEKKKTSSIRAPGTLPQHYAPQTPLSIVQADHLDQMVQQFLSEGKSIVVISQKAASLQSLSLVWFQMPNEPPRYMSTFYDTLFMADQSQKDMILIEALSENEGWNALRDRMERAAS